MIGIRPRPYPLIELPWARVVVTGGARGIGLAPTRALVAAGAQVWIGDLDPDVALTTVTTHPIPRRNHVHHTR